MWDFIIPPPPPLVMPPLLCFHLQSGRSSSFLLLLFPPLMLLKGAPLCFFSFCLKRAAVAFSSQNTNSIRQDACVPPFFALYRASVVLSPSNGSTKGKASPGGAEVIPRFFHSLPTSPMVLLPRLPCSVRKDFFQEEHKEVPFLAEIRGIQSFFLLDIHIFSPGRRLPLLLTPLPPRQPRLPTKTAPPTRFFFSRQEVISSSLFNVF